MDTDPPKYPPLTQAALVNYNHLNPFSEVVPAEKMAELEGKWEGIRRFLNEIQSDDNTPNDAYNLAYTLSLRMRP